MKYILLILISALFFSCGSSEKTESSKQTSVIKNVMFTDVTAEAAIDFVHFNGAFGKKYFPETNGAGGGWLDYDGDGWQDMLLIQGTSWPSKPDEKPTLKLYRNKGDGTFVDATVDAGMNVSVYGMGMTAADYDNDGDTDVFITCVGENLFFRNDNGVFNEIGKQAGVNDPAWGASAMFFDYDKDGWLDLFVCNYVKWSEDTDLECSLDGKNKGYCTPEIYEGEPSKLYRNSGDGTFEDVTIPAGVYSEESKALGVAVLDFNSDGWLDIAVANDTQPDFLF
ncbi:MAG: VCBS repeat-containing protein, partial [Calditrichota bacterium]